MSFISFISFKYFNYVYLSNRIKNIHEKVTTEKEY